MCQRTRPLRADAALDFLLPFTLLSSLPSPASSRSLLQCSSQQSLSHRYLSFYNSSHPGRSSLNGPANAPSHLLGTRLHLSHPLYLTGTRPRTPSLVHQALYSTTSRSTAIRPLNGAHSTREAVFAPRSLAAPSSTRSTAAASLSSVVVVQVSTLAGLLSRMARRKERSAKGTVH